MDGTERLWEEFHAAVNMSSRELRTWLLTEASEDEVFTPDPDLHVPELGRAALHVLGKRKTDLTPDDLDVMARVVAEVRQRLDQRPPAGTADSPWRHGLMDLGHDPLRPAPDAEG